PGARTTWALVGTGIGLLPPVLILLVIRQRGAVIPLTVLGLGLGAIGATLAVYLTRFKHTCSYVGRDGVARFVCSGDRTQLTVAEVFCFRDATELRTSQTRHYMNGAYQGTDYTFSWTDINGLTKYVIHGRHKSEQGRPPTGDKFHLAVAAEVAWTMHLL